MVSKAVNMLNSTVSVRRKRKSASVSISTPATPATRFFTASQPATGVLMEVIAPMGNSLTPVSVHSTSTALPT